MIAIRICLSALLKQLYRKHIIPDRLIMEAITAENILVSFMPRPDNEEISKLHNYLFAHT